MLVISIETSISLNKLYYIIFQFLEVYEAASCSRKLQEITVNMTVEVEK